MKKLARLTALLLTGALLLVLTACGAAPLAKEQQAKQQILTAINQYRTSNGAKAVDEIPELSKAEQFWVDAFRKEGDYKVLLIKTDLVYDDYDKMIPAEWEDGPCFGWYNISQDGQEYNLLETTDPSDTAALMQLFAEESDFNDVRYTALSASALRPSTAKFAGRARCMSRTPDPLSPTEQHPLNQTKPDSLRAVRLLVWVDLQAVTYSCTYPDSSSGNHRW